MISLDKQYLKPVITLYLFYFDALAISQSKTVPKFSLLQHYFLVSF